ncbi:serine hydrolase [Nocardiopsis sp. RSe5-2]|uniref:Serine hydrolase n=1 Tax=Nocardiopsis endophytica TaxID=3018445 RepID=A0ABT4TY59_9ACTN|nr:serine hydrolase domain-containing protein [Nocardiopsis endophytica]MDA2809619.1 serine hydrolase [Nocardiopsis endophytica]
MSDPWVNSASDTLKHALEDMVTDRLTPGAAAAIGAPDDRALVAVGTTGVDGEHPATPETYYDIASLTKVVATWPLVGRAVADGLVGLDAPLAKYFPDLAPQSHPGLKATMRQILTHTSGLMPSTRLDRYIGDERYIAEAILAEPLGTVGEQRYINRGFILAGLMLERLRGEPLGRLLDAHMSTVGVAGIGYGPFTRSAQVAPTERRIGGAHPVHGTVHDENAALLGGMAGHAGVFATAEGLADYTSAIIRARSEEAPVGAFVRESWHPMTRVDELTHRGLAWLIRDGGVVYHHGFTGTSLFLHPDTGRYLVLLTNAIAFGRERRGLADVRRVALGLLEQP